jgi:putative heme-binding domain-containing protein
VLKPGGGDPHRGKRLFDSSCAKCHLMFGEGGRIGPDLTTFRRDDLLNMLINVVNPSAEIREGFEQVMVVTHDGRAVSGLRFDQDQKVLVLRNVDGQNITVARSDIEETIPQPKSLMPEGLLNGLKDQEVRDLFAYLRSSQPLSASRR